MSDPLYDARGLSVQTREADGRRLPGTVLLYAQRLLWVETPTGVRPYAEADLHFDAPADPGWPPPDPWPDGPPDAAYSRVTEPERYAPLHDLARAVVADLLERYDVHLSEVTATP